MKQDSFHTFVLPLDDIVNTTMIGFEPMIKSPLKNIAVTIFLKLYKLLFKHLHDMNVLILIDSRWRDLNSRSSLPKSDAITKLRHT